MIENVPQISDNKNSNHIYIDKMELNRIVQKCIENDRVVSNELAQKWELMIDNMLKAKNFFGYPNSWKQDMKSYAFMKLLRSMNSIDMTKCKSAFGYYYRIIYLAFLTELGKIKREETNQTKIRDDMNKALTFMKYMNTDSRAEY